MVGGSVAGSRLPKYTPVPNDSDPIEHIPTETGLVVYSLTVQDLLVREVTIVLNKSTAETNASVQTLSLYIRVSHQKPWPQTV